MNPEANPSLSNGIQELTQHALLALMRENPELLLIDVRTPQEYRGLGHIPGSVLIPLDELPGHLDTLQPNRQTVIICEHGVRSRIASEFLVYKGFRKICNLTTGMADWTGPRKF